MRSRGWLTSCLLVALALTAGCATIGEKPLNVRAFEERYLGLGYSNLMYRYGEDLYAQGRYREALNAFRSAEDMAYSEEMREGCRRRRMYLERVVAALENGQPAPRPPLNQDQIIALQEARRKKAEAGKKVTSSLDQPGPTPVLQLPWPSQAGTLQDPTVYPH